MKLLSFLSPSFIGLDICPQGMRLVELQKTKRGLKQDILLKHMAMSDLPSSIFMEGKIQDWDQLASLLKDFLQCHYKLIKNKSAAIGLPVDLVRMQHLQLPVGMTDAEIRVEINMQMQKDLPGMTEALSIDFTVKQQENSVYCDVFFTATRQAYLLKYADCVRCAGLNVKIIDVDIYAMTRAVCCALSSMKAADEVNAILHITRDIALLIVFNQQEIIFHRYWRMTSTVSDADFLLELKQHLQTILIAHRRWEITKLAMCGEDKYLDLMAKETNLSWTFTTCYPKLTDHIHIVPHLDKSFLAKVESHLLVAYGLALQEMPVW